MMHYRKATNQDLPYLYNIDLKCHEQPPANQMWWGKIAENTKAGCTVACKSQVPIGMIVWQQQVFTKPGDKTKTRTLHIPKLCVRKEFRGGGIGQRLLAYGHEEARGVDCPYMSMAIPSYRCLPESRPDDDVSKWLGKLGFGAMLVLPTKISMYGEDYEQYLFTFEVNK
jgi:GNAT superfamily N-acetyltransferase